VEKTAATSGPAVSGLGAGGGGGGGGGGAGSGGGGGGGEGGSGGGISSTGGDGGGAGGGALPQETAKNTNKTVKIREILFFIKTFFISNFNVFIWFFQLKENKRTKTANKNMNFIQLFVVPLTMF
jgi:hypothetical protein